MEGVRAPVRKSHPWERFGRAVTVEPSRVLAAPTAFLGRAALPRVSLDLAMAVPATGPRPRGPAPAEARFPCVGPGWGSRFRAGSGRKDTTPRRWVGRGAEAKGHSGPEGSVRSRHMSLLLKVRRSEQVT